MRRLPGAALALALIFTGCGKAEISFVSHADGRALKTNVASLRWSFAMSGGDITQLEGQQEVDYNTPRVGNRALGKLLLFDWVKTGEQVTVKVKPGVYDGLIVMDSDGDGKVDSFLGTIASQVKLRRFELFEGERYAITVHEDQRVEFVQQR